MIITPLIEELRCNRSLSYSELEEQQGHKVVTVISMEFDLFLFELNKMCFVEKFKKLSKFQNSIMIKLYYHKVVLHHFRVAFGIYLLFGSKFDLV